MASFCCKAPGVLLVLAVLLLVSQESESGQRRYHPRRNSYRNHYIQAPYWRGYYGYYRHSNMFLGGQAAPSCGRHGSYNYHTHTCCNGHISPGRKLQCCDKMAFEPINHVCCQGKVMTVTDGNTRCCGRQSYNPKYHSCCYSRLSFGGNLRCCGNRGYNPKLYSCCQGHVMMGKRCCGIRPYDPEHHTCCYGYLFGVARGQCCGVRAYDPNHYTCCYGRVYGGILNC